MTTKSCPWCGQGKFKIVDCARCIVCDNIVHLDKYDHGASSSKGKVAEPCRHLEDGMVHCTTCDELTWDQVPSGNMDYHEFTGLNTNKKKWWRFWK